jgi:hypothetical protein
MKWFKRVLFSVLGISLVIGGVDLYSRYVDNNTFRAVDAINGIYLGQSREDLLFLKDLKLNCSDSDVPPSECDSFFILEPRYDMKTTGLVDLELDRVVRVEKVSGFPRLRINDTEDLVRRAGEANVYSISTDFEVRSYSYVDIPWTFQFEKDQLRRVELGKVRTRYALNLTDYRDEDGYFNVYEGSKILVRGRQVCPGSECPFKDGDRIEDKILGAKELEELLLKRTE